MKKMTFEMSEIAYNKLLDIQLDKKKQKEKETSLSVISGDIFNTLLENEELLKQVLELMSKKEEDK